MEVSSSPQSQIGGNNTKYSDTQESINRVEYLETHLLATLSHEIKTPLSIILGVVQLLPNILKDIDYMSKSLANEYIEMLKRNCYRLIKLTDNLIDITNIDCGLIKLHFCNHNIVSLVENVTLSVEKFCNFKKVTLDFNSEIEEEIIACDLEKMEKVLLNLLSNAIKFVKVGGNINVNIRKHKNILQISIKDNGIGIPKDKIKTIFNRLNRADCSFSRPKEGSGMGLSIAKSLVQMHHGTISLVSKIGQGSEFIINLPARKTKNTSKNPILHTGWGGNISRVDVELSDIYELY